MTDNEFPDPPNGSGSLMFWCPTVPARSSTAGRRHRGGLRGMAGDGPEFLTEPKAHGREIRTYIRDPGGHLIRAGQATVRRPGWGIGVASYTAGS